MNCRLSLKAQRCNESLKRLGLQRYRPLLLLRHRPPSPEGYGPGYAGALVAAAGTLGSIIPPSILLVIYGVQTGTSIQGLFLAGIVPGFTVALGMIFVAIWIARRRRFPVHPPVSFKEAVSTTVSAIPVLVLPLIVVVGVVSGVFTITESAGAAVVYALVLTLFRHKGRIRGLPQIFTSTALETASVAIVIAASAALAWPLTRSQIPAQVAQFIMDGVPEPILIILLINALLLFLGMFLAPVAGLILTTPLLLPLGAMVQMDPLQLGVMTVFNLNLGLLTPPVGLGLFITARIAGTSLLEQVREVLPFLAVNLFVLGLISYWPGFTTFLPSILDF